MKKVAVIGAGEMGHGIAEVFALNGYSVRLIDVEQRYLDRGMERIAESLSRLEKRGDLSREDAGRVLKRVSASTDMAKGVRDAEIVIEAVPEIPGLKEEVFRKLSAHAPSKAILGSNTSNIRISEIAAHVSDPSRVIGIHFFNPAVVMKLVEVVRGEKTSDETVDAVRKMLEALKKTPVIVLRDRPGFIVNRINAAGLLLFGLLQDRAVATPEEIDAFARSQGLPMGPYELIDYVGVDVVKNSLDYYARELSPAYGRCRVYADLVGRGMLGKKSGHGFYDWSAGRPRIDGSKATDRVSLMDIFAVEINEAVKLVEEGVASPEEIETAVRLGMNRPFGPVSVAKSLTNAEVKQTLDRLSSDFDMQVFSPAESIVKGKLRDAIEGRAGPALDQGREKGGEARQTGGTLLIEEQGQVARITINRPKYNMINADVLSELGEALDALWDRRDIRVIVVTGSGQHFSSGAELSTFIAGSAEFVDYARKGARVFRRLSDIPKITIASLKGYVLGGALELALACDIRLASEDVRLAFPEITRGLVPAWGGTQLLTRMIGPSRALGMILTGERVSAADAHGWGLVTKIVGDADAESMEYARGLAANSAPIAAQLAKKLVHRAAEASSDIGLEMESLAAGILFGTDDLKEGIGAFLQKRKPEFKGK